MGLLSAANAPQINPARPWQPQMPMQPPMTPQMPSMGQGQGNPLLAAFSNNPGFAAQLGNIMQGQGPGNQAPVFTPPQMPVGQAPQVRPGQATRGGPFFGQGLQRPW